MATRFSPISKICTAVLLLFTLSGNTQAQEYNSFRLVNSNEASLSGYVSTITFDADANQLSINYLNVAGVSSVFTVALEPSAMIPESLSVFLPQAGFTEKPTSALDLSEIQLLTGRVIDSGGNSIPKHWFRITKANNRWSGAFRLDNRLYTLDRYADPETIDMRQLPAAGSTLPTRSIKVSAVINELYLQTAQTEAKSHIPAHLPALESIHIMDGLLTDNLATTIQLMQLIYQSSEEFANSAPPLTAAESWLSDNSAVFGLTDNLATIFFKGSVPTNNTGSDNPRNGQAGQGVVVVGNSANYQLATSHYFGELLGLDTEVNTLQEWRTQGPDALPHAHWSEQQKSYFADNPPPPELTRTLSYDEPEVAITPEKPVDEVDSQLVLAELPESGGVINDDPAQQENTVSGAGAGHPTLLVLCGYLLFRQRRKQ